MRKIGLFVFPGFQVMSLGTLSAFEVANKRSGKILYDLQVLSEKGGLLRNSIGIDVSTKAIGDDEFDTILVGSGIEVLPTSPAAASYLRQAAKSTRRLASVCLGAFVLGDCRSGSRSARSTWTRFSSQTGRFGRRRACLQELIWLWV